MKNTLLALLAASLFVPGLALAHGDRDSDRRWDPHPHPHRHDASCRHDPPPRHRPHERGRYELRTVRDWVDGYYAKTWIPERCWTERRGRHGRRLKTVCKPGHYESRWVDGHFVHRHQWVWVPYGHRRS